MCVGRTSLPLGTCIPDQHDTAERDRIEGSATYLAFRAVGLLGTTDSRAEILRQGKGHCQRSSECENRKANHLDSSMRMQ